MFFYYFKTLKDNYSKASYFKFLWVKIGGTKFGKLITYKTHTHTDTSTNTTVLWFGNKKNVSNLNLNL